ncbi:ImmA/IrrE family metallo-endopeptidase [Phototrophicus methaneseepsis]|uniref:ImmA/IrrE family metallo-endopeptidase n=1 Tax=Phototrophicus methaneseepsis TaxID=2710758 RepID=A0A7S8E7D3_9CHLR|nr:ImmA/IrrE family metallo-endopeptidase [Phototrophicus methaneseepsis]QPC81727.1 ImmA/IrrE family metallo-endopeptidase [Phototrophicus methaneseepsis]
MTQKQDAVKAVIDKLDYDFDHFELNGFIRHVECLLRREIILVPFAFNPGLSAMWVRAETAHYIFYNDRTHPIHQAHSILHEIGHIVLNHACRPIDQVLPPELLKLLQTLQPQGRLRKAGLPLRQDPEEQEAEMFVFVIQKSLLPKRRQVEVMGQSSSNEALRKWVDSMAFDV